MLTDDQNRTLTQIGPGTPMGDLLRSYWMPIAAGGELPERSVKVVRVLGEDLVLYRDGSGKLGLIERACAHRLTDLAFGVPDDYGLRCPLHGWLYNESGQCLDMPFEPVPFCADVKVIAYPLQEKAGLVWAYLGPGRAPFLPDWEPFAWTDGLVQVVLTVVECNWLQCQESSVDPWGAERLQHGDRLTMANSGLQLTHDEFAYGIHSRAQGTLATGEQWEARQTLIWPNGVFGGDERSCRFEWRVPVDDEHTLVVAWFFDRMAPGHTLPPGSQIVQWQGRLRDEDLPGSPLLSTHALNRLFTVWMSQKRIRDRTSEHLTEADRGVLLLRERLFSQLEVLADGGRAKGLVLDGSESGSISLPFDPVEPVAPKRSDATAVFPYVAGQPPDVADLYLRVVSSWDTAPS
ncbi:MAG: Rieske 2Fe-2S domain-containing protein [Dehalococcoidia bacterium]